VYTFQVSTHHFDVLREIETYPDFLPSASITSTNLPYCGYFPPSLFLERTPSTLEERQSVGRHNVRSIEMQTRLFGLICCPSGSIEDFQQKISEFIRGRYEGSSDVSNKDLDFWEKII
jgi:hypothetical protein